MTNIFKYSNISDPNIYSDIRLYQNVDTNIFVYSFVSKHFIQIYRIFVRVIFLTRIYSDIRLYQNSYKCHTLIDKHCYIIFCLTRIKLAFCHQCQSYCESFRSALPLLQVIWKIFCVVPIFHFFGTPVFYRNFLLLYTSLISYFVHVGWKAFSIICELFILVLYLVELFVFTAVKGLLNISTVQGYLLIASTFKSNDSLASLISLKRRRRKKKRKNVLFMNSSNFEMEPNTVSTFCLFVIPYDYILVGNCRRGKTPWNPGPGYSMSCFSPTLV